jgi:hypothetical protein
MGNCWATAQQLPTHPGENLSGCHRIGKNVIEKISQFAKNRGRALGSERNVRHKIKLGYLGPCVVEIGGRKYIDIEAWEQFCRSGGTKPCGPSAAEVQ